MNSICDHNICTGCQICRLICPVGAINMKENERGHIYPFIDTNKCIDCKKCQRLCPSINKPIFNTTPIQTYAAFVKNQKARHHSTSGGISYAVSEAIIKNGGYFCGAVWTKNGAQHKITNDIHSINSFQGSKYSHSDIGDTYEIIKKLLEANKKVVFTGTPCQVAGLYKYLNKTYSNLYTIDLICHGVPSRKIIRDCIHRIEESCHKSVINLRFREKVPDQKRTCVKYTFSDNSTIMESTSTSFLFRCFADNYALRENCFRCQYAQTNRIADMTLADFWGYVPENIKFFNCWKGISIILVNNNRGRELFNLIQDKLIFETRSLNENNNQNLHKPQLKPKNYENFWNDYLNGMNYNDIYNKYFTTKVEIYKPSFIQRTKLLISLLLPKCLVRAIINYKQK